VNSAAEKDPSASGRLEAVLFARGARHGLILLAVLLAPVLWEEMPVVGAMRLAWLDTYQAFSPRERRSAPAMIVAIDEASLDQFGQWPWPRSVVAQLIGKLRAADPAAIGVDILFSEPDRLSPEWLALSVSKFDRRLAHRLAGLPHHDATLAAAIKSAPVVLGVAGLESGSPDPAAPFALSLQKGGDARPFLRHYASALRSLPEIDAAAQGHGLLSADIEGGVIRRVPMVSTIGTAPVLPLSLETLRVASGNPIFVLNVGADGVENVSIGDLIVPTQRDGRLWVHFTPHNADRFVSAVDVLNGTVDRTQFESKIVLVGVTGLGLTDFQTTPLGARMLGVEIHAQILEQIFDGDLLARPRWAPWAEAFAAFVLGILVIYVVPRFAPRYSSLVLALLLISLGAGGFAAYKGAGLLIDASVPGAVLALLFAAMLAETLAEANAQRKLLRERLQHERETAARFAGELDAARRIQIGILPRPEQVFPAERRFEIFASMEPAREVGGDLYDFFMLGAHRLFFLVGDVSGKGLPASIFMAVSKALCKGAALRRSGRVDEVLQEASAEISRENPESLFVTVFAGVLDVRTGLLEYCSAGHEAPFVFSPGSGEIVRLEAGGGPPLCVLEEFPYVVAEYRMSRGATLCLVSDGVTEAMNAAGELYGSGRLRRAIDRSRHTRSVAALGNAIRSDVAQFVAGAEATDDITLLVLRWNSSGDP